MPGPVEVPLPEDLAALPVEVSRGEEPWVTSVVARASDGDEVTFAWDEVAAAAHVRWTTQGADRLVIEQESVVKVSIHDAGTRIEFHAWLRSDDLQGRLVVRVGTHVTVSEALLRA